MDWNAIYWNIIPFGRKKINGKKPDDKYKWIVVRFNYLITILYNFKCLALMSGTTITENNSPSPSAPRNDVRILNIELGGT